MTGVQKRDLLNAIAQKIYDKKGFNIIAMDVHEVSTLADIFIIAEGNVERHVQSLCREVLDTLEAWGMSPFHLDGERVGDWIVIDCGEILIHLFISQLREKYRLEELWPEAEIIDLSIKLEGKSHE